MSSLDSLYQELILDHSRNPQGFGLGEGDGESHQYNPTCGDEVTLRLRLDADAAVVEAISWEGHGCSISQASASLLSELVPGLTVDELRERIALFRAALRSRGTIEIDEELFGDAVALGGVSRYIARVKCAMLAWVAAEDALGLAVAARA